MTLYHFTAPEYLQAILTQGIIKGDVPLSATRGFQAPWLTTDSDPDHQEWGRGSVLNKRAIRLTINVPEGSAPPILARPRPEEIRLPEVV